jgi:hypothetical protein
MPLGHAQPLAVHICVVPHLVPQAWQLSWSRLSTHMSPQTRWPSAHAQFPLLQLWPLPHALPHLPQFAVLLLVFTQLPLHST